MSRTLRALLLLACTAACASEAPPQAADAAKSKSPATAEAMPGKPEPAKVEPPKGDPTLLKVCKAFDEVAAEGKAEQDNKLMSRTAVRATELGVNEAQLEALGPQPPQLLASIRKRGNPPECAAFVAYLEALP